MADEHTERDNFQEQMEEQAEAEGQASLFDKGKSWQNHWQGMPEYEHEDQTPFRSLLVHFASQQDLDEFLALLDQTVTERTKYLWYPELKHATFMNKGWRGADRDDGVEVWRTNLDEHTCDNCRALDGADCTMRWPPHPDCENPDGCRCTVERVPVNPTTDLHEHDWHDVTTYGETRRQYICTVEGCGAKREGDEIETPVLEDLADEPEGRDDPTPDETQEERDDFTERPTRQVE